MLTLDEARRRAAALEARLAAARSDATAAAADLRAARRRVRDARAARSLLQDVAEAVQRRAHERVAAVATRALAIFDDPYRVRLDLRQARGRTEARVVLERGGLEVDPASGAGGGVADVAAFALRLACLALRRPRLRRLLVLDEPFRFVSADVRPRVRSMLESLARELGVQVVLVTHDPALRVGRVVDLEEADVRGRSRRKAKSDRPL